MLDLNQLVVGCLSTLRRLVGPRIQVVWAPASHLDAIVADSNQLEHVLTQLSTNARESMPDGGTLELSTRQEPLDGPRLTRLSGQRPGIYVTLQVRDSGRGMDAATLERIFEPFFSTKLRERRRWARPRERLRHHQAERRAHRRRERARSRHHVYDLLPAARGERPRGCRPWAAWEAFGGEETILLVEDEEQVRELARRVLERVGYTVLSAPDAETAIALADRHAGHIHLLVADMMLPQSGGRELAARLSIHRPAIKVLYISGTSDGSIARLRLVEPGTAFLEKPFSLDRLLRTVRRALDDPDGAGRPA